MSTSTRMIRIALVLAGAMVLLPGCTVENAKKVNPDKPPMTPVAEQTEGFTDGFPSKREKHQVVRWLMLNNLNRYGDPMGTLYSGSTPLYDEVTGETISRYKYLVEKHPGKPWLRIQVPEGE